MDLSRQFIILNGEAKTLQIHTIEKNSINTYRVRFRNNPKPYTYVKDKVIWLSDPEYVNLADSKVYIDGVKKTDIKCLLKFTNGRKTYWRIIHLNGYTEDDANDRVRVSTSCLCEKRAKETFMYLRNVAAINPLCNEENGNALLGKLYDGIDFIDEKTAASCYLNPDNHKPREMEHGDLIYPFGCNASQKKAVAAAFEHQLSVIQGPPGTGKTQTILNIIANIVCQGKSVLVVSNNNSAITNVYEKLDKRDLSFIVAPLGCKDNKDAFIANQPIVPAEIKEWRTSMLENLRMQHSLRTTSKSLDNVFALRNEMAELEQEWQAIDLEWRHFCMCNGLDENMETTRHIKSGSIISLWLQCQLTTDKEQYTSRNWFVQTIENLKWRWLKWRCEKLLQSKTSIEKEDISRIILELQKQYYLNRRHEIAERTTEIKKDLDSYDAKELTDDLTKTSLTLFKSALAEKYSTHTRMAIADVKELRKNGDAFIEQYPVILSTTFSARTCQFTEKPYDYIIMDEASQVSIETGFMALTCAYNAVIVGDSMQLPNVMTEEDRQKLNVIFAKYNISNGYDCAKNSFLQSVLSVVKNIPETLLREHYRCHPLIINFCNQKFYGGNLLIMTEDKGEDNVLYAIKTSKGNHAVNHYNQREIDVVRESVLPNLQNYKDIGIVTPYNSQVNEFQRQLPNVKAATIHKYQGREKDVIIFSVVDNQISDFADNANMLNVAVSRAKKKFCLVVTGNNQEKRGNITELLDYIAYNNCMVTESKLASIFDYLYAQYSEQLQSFLTRHPNISEYASENLTYALLVDVLASENRFTCLKVLCHIPLMHVFQDTSLMSEDEMRYAANPATHLDFLIINRVSHKPVLAIETDGYSFHNGDTAQRRRDLMKDNILKKYGLPLLRLSTKGSAEREKVTETLNMLMSM